MSQEYNFPFCRCPDEEPETLEEAAKWAADMQDAADRRGEEMQEEVWLKQVGGEA